MLIRQFIWVVFLTTLGSAFTSARGQQARKWIVTQNSSLSVNGTTNINKFTCNIPSYDKTDTITLISNNNNSISLSGKISLMIQSFDCQNPMMTHDLRKTLKEKEYPHLFIYFMSLKNLPEIDSRPALMTGMVRIELAGVSKNFEINYQVFTDDKRITHLIGVRDLNFSDFNILPPRKLGGMFRTNNELKVTFHLKINAF